MKKTLVRTAVVMMLVVIVGAVAFVFAHSDNGSRIGYGEPYLNMMNMMGNPQSQSYESMAQMHQEMIKLMQEDSAYAKEMSEYMKDCPMM